MSLFAALTAKDGNDAGSGTLASALPEAAQLHADRVIDFLKGTTIHLGNPTGPSPAKPAGEEGGGDDAPAAGEDGGCGYRSFAALSYQAVQTQREEGAGGAAAAPRRHPRPDLGVWDCRVGESNVETAALLLRRVVVRRKANTSNVNEGGAEETATATAGDGASPPIVMAVDLSDPAEVQPAVERMRRAILGIYASPDEEKVASSNNNRPRQAGQCTTSTKALQEASFGRALIQEHVAVDDNEPRIALILAAIVPSVIATAKSSSASAAEEYRERQARALLLYHLHKFSLEVNCTLCFVGDGRGSPSAHPRSAVDGEETEAAAENDLLLGSHTTLSVDELGRVVRCVARGLPPMGESGAADTTEDTKAEDATEDATKADKAGPVAAPSPRPPAVYAPGTHDAELVCGAYQRNASCEGRWDAGRDDLAMALPPRRAIKDTQTRNGGRDGDGGDEAWLSQLAAAAGLAPAAAAGVAPDLAAEEPRRIKKEKSVKKRPSVMRNRSSVARNKDAKPKDEKEVMNFFDNLLKK